jgi:hypothetical protein
MVSKFTVAAIAMSALFLGGCFVDEESQGNVAHPDPANPGDPVDPAPPGAVNNAPKISGTPGTVVLQDEFYEFMPQASDADGDALAFSISRKPAWAKFDPTSGRLWGTPKAADVGNFTNIRISVSDGKESASLGAFDLSVDPLALGSATLSWNPPTDNTDGSALTDLAGYRIYYGRNKQDLKRSVVIQNPGLTRYVIENLTPARWHFAMTSINSAGLESPRSQTVSKIIS